MTATDYAASPYADESGIVRRALPAGVQLRAAQDDDGTRSITGIGVPYGETFHIFPGLSERFEPGACDDDARALALYRHDVPIGKLTASRDVDAGREVTLTLSATPTADEAYTLARDEVIRSFSIGFRPVEYRVETDDDGNETIVHTRVEVLEYSLVPFPAYSEARITNVRHRPPAAKEHPMTTEALTRADLDKFSDDVTTTLQDIERRMAEWQPNAAAVDAIATRAEQFASIGDWVTAVANDSDARHEDALALHRDITTSDVPSKLVDKPGFIGDLTKRITERRRWIGRFRTRPLPAKGMTVDYIKTNVTATVAEQLNELDPLPKGTAFTVTPDNAPVRTFGGGQTVSRQVIDRSDAWALTGMFEAFAIQYARETEAATRAYVTALIDAKLAAGTDVIDMPAGYSAFDWTDAIVDAAGQFEDLGYDLTALTVSPDIFKALAREAGLDGRPLLTVHGAGVNVVGELDLPAASGSLMRLPVNVLHGSTGKALFYDPVAIETLESPGAPFWLQEDRALNLARDYACYGYIAHINPHPAALVPVKFAAA